MLTECPASKKGKTTDKFSCVKERKKCWQSVLPKKKEETLFTKCHESKIYITEKQGCGQCVIPQKVNFIYIHNHEIQKKVSK